MLYAVFNLRTGRIVALYGREELARLNANLPELTVRRVLVRGLRHG